MADERTEPDLSVRGGGSWSVRHRYTRFARPASPEMDVYYCDFKPPGGVRFANLPGAAICRSSGAL